MRGKIVVTGYGIITNLGVGVEANKEALLSGVRPIGRVAHLNTSHTELPCGEVPLSDEELRRLADAPDSELLTRNPLLAMVALREAMATSGLTDSTPTAFINGTTVGGMEKSERFYRDFFEGKNTAYISAHDCGYGTEKIGNLFGRLEMQTTISTACSSAANSIILGADLIRSGRVDAAIAGGSESLSKFHLNGFNALKILETQPCRPFDKRCAGLNLGEGAAYIVLESEESAQRRNAPILCTLSGYANCCDAYHQTATSPESVGEVLAMTRALQMSALAAKDISYINAHGTGTPDNDLHESIALRKVFGDDMPPFSSTKSLTGHTTSAAGAVEAVFSVLTLQHGFIPGNPGFEEPIEETGLRPVCRSYRVHLKHVMTNSFGFGGNDSTCIFSQYQTTEP